MLVGKLNARKVATAGPGKYGDGGGLWLHVRINGSRAWVFRYSLRGTAHNMGLGPLATVSLVEARAEALRCRKLLRSRLDPINERRQERTKALGALTFKQCAERYIKAHEAGWRNPKHRQQWANTLATYAFPVIGDLPAGLVDTGYIMRVLEPIWHAKPETASRLRGRLEAVLDWATVRGYRVGENPARWKGHLQALLPTKASLRAVVHHAALPYLEIPAVMSRLRQQPGIGPRALEFAILTAARSGEVRGMTWDEVKGDTWTIPASRMKAKREHRVPLSIWAMGILQDMRAINPDGLVFASVMKRKRPLSSSSLTAVLKRMGRGDLTQHGFRSTFRDWAAERTAWPREVCEAALAHEIGNVEAAYRRGDLFDKRRKLMDAWTIYCASPPVTGAVVPIRRGG